MAGGAPEVTPLFIGNFSYQTSQREVERLLERYGALRRLDMKTGFAFAYFEDDRDGEDAIRSLDGRDFGDPRRRLRVEWSKGDGIIKQRERVRRPKLVPTTSLFIVNFEVERTRERDLEEHFRTFGRLIRVQIKRNYAFVEYETVAEATEALEACNGGRFHGRTLTVEYVSHDADGRKGDKPVSPRRRSRSASPRRYRGSPRYDRSRDRSRERSSRRSRSRDRRSRSRERRRTRTPLSPSRSRSPSRSGSSRSRSRSR